MGFDDNKEQWLKEFTEFSQLDSSKVDVPSALFESLKKRIFPSPWMVLGKVAGIHVVVGFLSLGICSQFGLNPFQTERSLADLFMRYGGHNFCMLACGVLFMATTYLAANMFLVALSIPAMVLPQIDESWRIIR